MPGSPDTQKGAPLPPRGPESGPLQIPLKKKVCKKSLVLYNYGAQKSDTVWLYTQVRTVLCTHEPGQSCFLRTLRSKVPHSRSGPVSSLQESEPGFWPSNLEAQYGAPKATHCGPSGMWGQFGVGGMLTIPIPTAIPPGNYPSPGNLPKPCKNRY